MIITLAWKEIREHLPIWLTMVVMTCIMGAGLLRLVATDDPAMAQNVAGLAILILAATYGVVCGSMMLAGEHEGGTLVLLDIFLGRRGLLWTAKVAVGLVLAVTEALAVSLILHLLNHATPVWGIGLIGVDRDTGYDLHWFRTTHASEEAWLLLLPLLTVEAYVWGLFGSSLTRRVLTAAGCAAAAAAPVWCIGVGMPATAFLGVRLVAILGLLIFSCIAFVTQARETTSELTLTPDEQFDQHAAERRKLLEMWEQFDHVAGGWSSREQPHSAAVQVLAPVEAEPDDEPMVEEPAVPASAGVRRQRQEPAARSPGAALWWLTCKQAAGTWTFLGVACLVLGILLPAQGPLFWPMASLLLGVVCGTATFAAEQRDLSYQFLAAQHLPLPAIWRFKTAFWSATAIVAAVVVVVLCGLLVAGTSLANGTGPGSGFLAGTLPQLMGPLLYVCVWLVYGFCTGQVIVWLCRKTIMALLLALLVSAGAVGVWLPSLLCRGMSGWQLWLAPLGMLAASRVLVRAWAGGRIKERKPFYALAGLGLAAVAWLGVNLGHRAWEVPDAGPPVDLKAFRQSIASGDENLAAKKIRDAADIVSQGRRDDYLPLLAEAERFPAGVLEAPPSEGQHYQLSHLPACNHMTDRLCHLAWCFSEEPDQALAYLAQALALSRNLRRKAPFDSYLAGVRAERRVCAALEQWRAAASSRPASLRSALDLLNRHAAETPPLLDCLEAECYRGAGLLEIPAVWEFAQPGGWAGGGVPEPWLVRGVVLSLEMPWEAQRKQRLWQAVWAGLIRAGQTPCWQLPKYPPDPATSDEPARNILHGWLPASKGPGAAMTAARLADLLAASWVTDAGLFCPVVPLQIAATRGRCCVDADRLALALALYQVENGKPAARLDDLVPKYLPQLPVDPYSGQAFGYRIARAEEALPGAPGAAVQTVRAGQGILWSTGPDRVDDGGRKDGSSLDDDHYRWPRGGFDLIRVIPR